MSETDYAALAEAVIEEKRYLAIATTAGSEPWVAPVEYIRGEDGTFYFFSTDAGRHSADLEADPVVSAAIYGADQPEYAPDNTGALKSVQIGAGRGSSIPTNTRNSCRALSTPSNQRCRRTRRSPWSPKPTTCPSSRTASTPAEVELD